MTGHHRVPDELAQWPFVGSIAVRSGLLTANELRGPTWVRLLRGVYVRAGRESDPQVRVHALRLVVGLYDVVCGVTAAWLHGVWTPPPGGTLPLEIARPLRAHGQQPAGLRRRRLVLLDEPDADDVVDMDGVHVTSGLRTCVDVMRERSLVEAVVVADAFAHRGLVRLPSLRAYCAERRRWPNIRRARAAADLANAGARSPGESRLRMVIVLAGYDEPLVNVPVYTRQGVHLGTPDLTLPAPRWVHLEYDGAYHDEQAQHGRDLRRQNGLQREGRVPLLRYDWRHVLRERHVVLRDLVAASGEEPRFELDERDFKRADGAGHR